MKNHVGIVPAALLFAATIAITACSVRPDGSNGQRRDFDVPGMSYEVAYHHASNYFQQCTRGIVGFAPNVVNSNIYTDAKRGEVIVQNNSGLIVARTTVTATNGGSHIKVVTIKRPPVWDRKDQDAAESTVRSGAVVCP